MKKLLLLLSVLLLTTVMTLGQHTKNLLIYDITSTM